jgi:hypothetical protein
MQLKDEKRLSATALRKFEMAKTASSSSSSMAGLDADAKDMLSEWLIRALEPLYVLIIYILLTLLPHACSVCFIMIMPHPLVQTP